MHVVAETPDRTTTTAAGAMAALAGPSRGSTELANWRVRMPANAAGPLHAIDREQLWTVIAGTLDVGDHTVQPGETVILPAGELRQITAGPQAVEALVCMAIGGRAQVPGNEALLPLPWAQ